MTKTKSAKYYVNNNIVTFVFKKCAYNIRSMFPYTKEKTTTSFFLLKNRDNKFIYFIEYNIILLF